MDPKIIETIERCAAASYTATISFRDVIAALVGQGIESTSSAFRRCRPDVFLDVARPLLLPVASSALADDAHFILHARAAWQPEACGWLGLVLPVTRCAEPLRTSGRRH